MLRLQLIVLLFTCVFCGSCQKNKISTQHKALNVAIILPQEDENTQNTASIISNTIKANKSNNIQINITEYTTKHIPYYSIFKNDNKPNIIVGPTASNDSVNLINFANKHSTPIISLSNNKLLANNNNVFVLGYQHLENEKILIDYFIQQNYENFIFIGQDNDTSKKSYHELREYLNHNNIQIQYSDFICNETDLCTRSLENLVESINNISTNNNNKPIVFLDADLMKQEQVRQYIKEYSIDQKAIICVNDILLYHKEYFQGMEITFVSSKELCNFKNTSIKNSSMDILAYDIGLIIAESIGDHFDKNLFLYRLSSLNQANYLSGTLSIHNKVAERKYQIFQKTNKEEILLLKE